MCICKETHLSEVSSSLKKKRQTHTSVQDFLFLLSETECCHACSLLWMKTIQIYVCCSYGFSHKAKCTLHSTVAGKIPAVSLDALLLEIMNLG